MPKQFQVGDVIRDDFRVLSVHNGYLGIVYVCIRDGHGEPARVAIKTFRFNDEICRQLFDRELDYWVRLPRHPNLVHAIEADRKAKLLILEFVHGPTLHSVASRSPLHPRFFRTWAKQTAEGLKFLHEDNNFVHRDVRPANVLLDIDASLRAKVSDLGLGKPFDADAMNHTAIGTFNYMAPEVFHGKTDYRSDIFGFGASLYFLLTGRLAVVRSTEDESTVLPARERIPEIPPAVDELISRCMSREPDERPASMSEVLLALDSVPDWEPETIRYELCKEHSYLYSIDARHPNCPFCICVEEFLRSKKRLRKSLS